MKLLEMLMTYAITNPDMVIKALQLLKARLFQKQTGELPVNGVSAEGVSADLLAAIDEVVDATPATASAKK